MKRIYLSLSVISIFMLLCAAAFAKPMMAPTLEEAIAHCDAVVLCEYSSFEERQDISYFNPPAAAYKVKEFLLPMKDAALTAEVKVTYSFHDGSACLEEAGFKFDASKMPKAGSEWILLLQKKSASGAFETYRGDFGRLPATPENIEKSKSLIKTRNNEKNSEKNKDVILLQPE